MTSAVPFFFFGLALVAMAAFWILFVVTAAPFLRKHGMPAKSLRYGSVFVRGDVNRYGGLLRSLRRPMTPFYALQILRYLAMTGVLLFIVSLVKTCQFNPEQQYEMIKDASDARFGVEEIFKKD